MRVSNLRSHNILHKKKNPNLRQQDNITKNYYKAFFKCNGKLHNFFSKNISILDLLSKLNDSRNVHCENMIANKI